MKRVASASFFLIFWLLALLTPGPLRADEPLLPSVRKAVCSRNGFFCALMDPDSLVTTIVRRRAGGVTENLWSMPGWFRVAFLSNDGEYLATGYDGEGLLPLSYRKDQVMLSFYDRGRLVRQVRLNEMITDLSSMEKTASHYHWGDYLGVNENDHLTVQLPGKKWVIYDLKTAREIK